MNQTVLAWALVLVAGSAAADIKVLVAVDPSDRESMVIGVQDIGASLSKAAGTPAKVLKSQDLSDAMRATRTGEYDVYIAPAHVAASALAHGYGLVGATEADDVYQLVARSGAKVAADLKGGRIYLPQQDSVAAYVARGMLNESGQSLKTFREVLYRRTSGAGNAWRSPVPSSRKPMWAPSPSTAARLSALTSSMRLTGQPTIASGRHSSEPRCDARPSRRRSRSAHATRRPGTDSRR